MLPTTSLNDLIAAVGQITTETVPALSGYANLAIGLGITLTVFTAVIGYFRYKNKSTPTTGYFTGTKNGLVYDKDQELGKMEYDIQTKGVWIK